MKIITVESSWWKLLLQHHKTLRLLCVHVGFKKNIRYQHVELADENYMTNEMRRQWESISTNKNRKVSGVHRATKSDSRIELKVMKQRSCLQVYDKAGSRPWFSPQQGGPRLIKSIKIRFWTNGSLLCRSRWGSEVLPWPTKMLLQCTLCMFCVCIHVHVLILPDVTRLDASLRCEYRRNSHYQNQRGWP